MLVLADLTSTKTDIFEALARLRQNDATKHLPVIGFSREDTTDLKSAPWPRGSPSWSARPPSSTSCPSAWTRPCRLSKAPRGNNLSNYGAGILAAGEAQARRISKGS